ncbi:unnamed protein product, partial [Prorocentrum cordatum]
SHFNFRVCPQRHARRGRQRHAVRLEGRACRPRCRCGALGRSSCRRSDFSTSGPAPRKSTPHEAAHLPDRKRPLAGWLTMGQAAAPAPAQPHGRHPQGPWTQLRRARRAARARELGYIGWRAGDGVTVLVCPAAARALLQQHDGGGPGLEKPDKLLLLEHALTGVSGEAWARQRRAFQEAVAGGQGVQRQRHGGAARAAAALARQCASIGHVRDRRAGVGGRGRGARGGLPAAGGGRARGRRAGGRAPGLPRGQGPGRRGRERGAEPAGHIDALLHGFAGCVRARTEQVRAALSDPAAGSRDSAALLARLLQRTCDLQPEEVLDNAHSCLLAGFDTIMALALRGGQGTDTSALRSLSPLVGPLGRPSPPPL